MTIQDLDKANKIVASIKFYQQQLDFLNGQHIQCEFHDRCMGGGCNFVVLPDELKESVIEQAKAHFKNTIADLQRQIEEL